MKYQDKYFSVLGDSISTFEGYTIPKNCEFYTMPKKLISGITRVSDTWWGGVIAHLGGKFLVNNSISGSTVCYSSSYEYQSYGCSDERTSSLHEGDILPNVIMVYLGTNDFGMGKKISSEDKTDLSVFENAYREMLNKLKTNYPEAEIWCVSLCTCTVSTDPSFKFDYYWGGIHITEYNKVIAKLCSNLNCKFIDIYNEQTPYDTMDEVHPNLSGMSLIRDSVLNKIV